MCLCSYVLQPLIAKEDIICYKCLKFDYLHNRVVTPYMDVEIPIFPYTMNADDEEKIKRNIGDLSQPIYCIGAGYIHCMLDLFPVWGHANQILVEARIPKGTKYYKGMYDDLCSKKLELIRVVPKKEIRKVLEGDICDYDTDILPLLYDKDEIQFQNQTIPF